MPLPLIALFLAAFAFGTTEFVIAGVLPDVAEGLHVSVPTAGYLVSGYALGIAVGGPLLTLLTPKVGRSGYVDPSDLAEGALTAGLSLTKSAAVSRDWQAHKLVRPKGGRR